MLRSLVVLVVLALATPALATQGLTIGIPRPYSTQDAEKNARALEGYLSTALKRPVEAKTFENYDQLADALAKGQVDLAWITPLSYVKAAKSAGVYPIAKALRRGLFYRSVFFVKADAKATTLKQLKGTKVAWVDQGSAAGYLFPRGLLLKEKLPATGFFADEKFLGDHKAVCNAVLDGTADVGATFANGGDDGSLPSPTACVEMLGAESGAKLRTIAVSDRIPNEVIAARAGFDEGIAGQLAGIFALLSDTAAGRVLLASVFRADGFGLALEQDFDAVRKVSDAVQTGRWSEDAPAKAAAPDAAAPKAKAKKKGK